MLYVALRNVTFVTIVTNVTLYSLRYVCEQYQTHTPLPYEGANEWKCKTPELCRSTSSWLF